MLRAGQLPLDDGHTKTLMQLGATFSSADPRFMNSLLPERAREMFQGLILLARGAASTDLILDVLLNSSTTLAGPVNDAKLHCELRYRHVNLRYAAFIEEHGRVGTQTLLSASAAGGHQWSRYPLRRVNYESSLIFASRANVTSVITEYHAMIKPCLDGDLIRRSPGLVHAPPYYYSLTTTYN